MGRNSKIEWTDHTFNSWWGCVKMGPGCAHCYAEAFASRWGFDVWGPNKPRRLFGERHWNEPLNWNRMAYKLNSHQKVFCGSMCDVFEIHSDPEWNEILNTERKKLWHLIEQTPHLIWMLLTKRPENMVEMAPWETWPDNVWALATAENQERADIVIPELLKVPAIIHGLSCEPLLGPLDLRQWLWELREYGFGPISTFYGHDLALSGDLDWIIGGFESGPRPGHPDWARKLRDDCIEAEVSFFWKQWGTWVSASQALIDTHGKEAYTFPDGEIVYRVGKKKAGRLLDGRLWEGFPGGEHNE